MADYHINVFWSEEDGCHVADIPDLAFCSAFGATPEEALRQVLQAKAAWLGQGARGSHPGASVSPGARRGLSLGALTGPYRRDSAAGSSRGLIMMSAVEGPIERWERVVTGGLHAGKRPRIAWPGWRGPGSAPQPDAAEGRGTRHHRRGRVQDSAVEHPACQH